MPFDAADDSNDNDNDIDHPPLEDLGAPPVLEQEGLAPDDNKDDDNDDNDDSDNNYDDDNERQDEPQ